jgi:hypothetical protein
MSSSGVRRDNAQEWSVMPKFRTTAKHLQGGAASTNAYSVYEAHERIREGDAQRWKAELRDPHDLAPTPLLCTPQFVVIECII